MTAVALFGVVLLIGGTGLAAAFTGEKFRSEFQRAHPQEWTRLGSAPFSGWRWRRSTPYSRYTFARRYRELGDARLTRLGDYALAARCLFLIVMVGLMVAMFGPAMMR